MSFLESISLHNETRITYISDRGNSQGVSESKSLTVAMYTSQEH